jgi:hypothetical protein
MIRTGCAQHLSTAEPKKARQKSMLSLEKVFLRIFTRLFFWETLAGEGTETGFWKWAKAIAPPAQGLMFPFPLLLTSVVMAILMASTRVHHHRHRLNRDQSKENRTVSCGNTNACGRKVLFFPRARD